jgi:hypothetical protein
MRTYHRLLHHRGADHTFSSCLNDGIFWVQNGKSVARAIVSSCLVCCKKNARLQWSLPANTSPRHTDLPVMSRVAIDVLHADGRLIFTCMCMDTGFLVMLPLKSTATDSVLQVLKRMENRFGVKIVQVRLDRAPGHTSRNFRFMAELEFTAPDTPYTNPIERLHREVRSILRTSQFLRRLVAAGDESALDEVAAVVNSRPLCMVMDNEGERGILTPAGLAFGAGANHSCGTVNSRTKDLRDYFYEQYFAIYRRVHHMNRKGRRAGKLVVGQPALYFQQDNYKICHVIDSEPPYVRIRVDGTTKLVGSGALAPLSLNFTDDDETSPFDVQRCGARVGVCFETVTGLKEFYGTVVDEVKYWGKVEVRWDPVEGQIWLNEVVDWGACRILV